jgi:FkbM family methyltransferase
MDRPKNYRPNTDDVTSIKEVFDDEVYNPKWFHLNTGEVKTIIDIGALIGSYTIWALQKYPNSVIFTYEPNPESFEYLFKNIKSIDDFDRVSVVNSAVSDVNTTTELFTVNNNTGGGSIFSQFRPSAYSDVLENPSINVKVVSISDILEFIKSDIDILKLDCEGAEYNIIYKMDLDKVRHIVMEFHNPQLEKSKVDNLINYLHSHGFVTHLPLGKDERLGLIYAKKIELMDVKSIHDLIDETVKPYKNRIDSLLNRKIIKLMTSLKAKC